MYNVVLTAHSWIRWVVIIAALFAIVRAVSGMSGRRPWTALDERAGSWFTRTMDLQILLGLILYVALSPITRAAMQDFAAAMRTGVRFWAVEHVFGMVVAAALAHVGLVRSRKLTDAAARHKVAAICYILALLAILVSIPWPGMSNGRPLIRW